MYFAIGFIIAAAMAYSGGLGWGLVMVFIAWPRLLLEILGGTPWSLSRWEKKNRIYQYGNKPRQK